jgi:two-component system, LytTR family, response regulator
MKPLRTIIIDDEAIARLRLVQMLTEYNGQFDVIAEAKNGIEGAELVNKLKPDLIFLDIQMPGKTGFEMLEILTDIPMIVFCTAYEEYALKAFNTLAIDYLVKPVEKERLQLTLDKIHQKSVENPISQVQELINWVKQQTDSRKLQSVPHKIGDRVLLIKTEAITHFAANEKYVEFFTADGKKYLTELSLKKLLERLPENFIQVQRALLVNANYVKEYRKYFKGKYILVLDDTNRTKLESGRTYADNLKQRLTIE